jgi:hypothetical protein
LLHGAIEAVLAGLSTSHTEGVRSLMTLASERFHDVALIAA